MGSMPRLKIKDEIRYRKGSTCDAANCERCVHFTSLGTSLLVPSQSKGLCKIIGLRDLARYRVRADYRCDFQEYDGFYKDKKC